MQLKFLESDRSYHSGYGAGSGEVRRETYACPCGKGTVIYEKDDIPGFKDSSTYCECEDCRSKYEFVRGTATSK